MKRAGRRRTRNSTWPRAGPIREIDRLRVTISARGQPIDSAMAMPAVAIARVSSVELAISRRNSPELARGKNVPEELAHRFPVARVKQDPDIELRPAEAGPQQYDDQRGQHETGQRGRIPGLRAHCGCCHGSTLAKPPADLPRSGLKDLYRDNIRHTPRRRSLSHEHMGLRRIPAG